MQVKIEGIPTLREYQAFQNYLAKANKRIVIYLSIMILCLILEWLNYLETGVFRYYFLIFGVLINILIAYSKRKSTKNSYQTFIKRVQPFQNEFIFEENQLSIFEKSESHQVNSVFEYSWFEKIVFSEDCLFLFLSANTAHLISRERVIEGDFDQLVQRLSSCSNFIKEGEAK